MVEGVLPTAPGAPQWVDDGASFGEGLDLLGLRQPVQRIGGKLLDGITSITPKLRYLSIRTWLLHEYISTEPPRPDSHGQFVDFASRVEAAIAIGNLLVHPNTTNVVGAREAQRLIHSDADPIEFDALVKIPAVRLYVGPSEQLALTQFRSPKVSYLDEAYGVSIAAAVGEQLEDSPLLGRIRSPGLLARATREELQEIGRSLWIDELSPGERSVFLEVLFPTAPGASASRRMATYGLLLSIADEKDAPPRDGRLDGDLLRLARSPEATNREPFVEVLNGWLLYQVRDAIAVSHEAVLAAIYSALRDQAPSGSGQGVSTDALISATAGRIGEVSAALVELDLTTVDEAIERVTVEELYSRVGSATRHERVAIEGVNRWTGGLEEPDAARAAWSSSGGAFAGCLISWMLADMRVGELVRAAPLAYPLLSSPSRLGLRQVVLPDLDEWMSQGITVGEALHALGRRTIDQHLSTVWTRLGQGSGRPQDVSLFYEDDGLLFPQGKYTAYSGGRPVTRLPEAIGWLGQLGLIDDSGITSSGRRILDRIVSSLRPDRT
jgi:hypothetical protein